MLSLFLLLFFSEGQSQIKFSVKGKEFWFSILPNFASAGGVNAPASDSVLLTISSEHNTSGVVENPAFGYSIPFTVSAYSVTEIPLPNNRAASLNSQVIDSTSIHIFAYDSITAFVANMQQYTRDATNLLPVQALGKEYMICSYSNTSIGISQFVIIASEDNTQLNITPTCNTAGGNAAGVPFDITLNRGQTYLVQGATTGDDLTGTPITSIESGTACANYTVIAGTSCTNIPLGCYACDQIFSIMNPTAAWGNEYLVAPFQVDSLATYRIVALNDNSDIFIDGSLIVSLNSGEYYEINHDSNAHCITSDSIFAVAQYMQGVQCSSDGDPAMLMINSRDQGVLYAIFNTIDVAGTDDTNFVTIITDHPGIGTVVFDGNPLDSNQFIQFPGCTDYYYTYVSLTQGTHVVQSSVQFSLYVYGMTGADSYAYSAGATIPAKAEVQDVNCATSKAVFTGDSTLAGGWWHPAGAYDDTLGTDLTIVLLAPIEPGFYVYSGYSSFTGCREDVYFLVEAPRTNFALHAFSDKDAVCSGEEVELSFIQREENFYGDFEDSLSAALFSEFSGVQTSTTCGTLQGDALLFKGSSPRSIATVDVDMSIGGFIEFFANANSVCDQPDSADVLIVEYSTNGGGSWIPFDTLQVADYSGFKRFRAIIPVGGQTTATRFKISEGGTFITNQDIWLLDELSLFGLNSTLTDSLNWTPVSAVSPVNAVVTTGTPLDSTYFTVFIRDSLGCVFSDSVLVAVPDTIVEPLDFDTVICKGDTIPFKAGDGASYQWNPSIGLSSSSEQHVNIAPLNDVNYVVKINDAYGCDSVYQEVNIGITELATVPNFFDTTLCNNSVIFYTVSNTETDVVWSDGSTDDVLTIGKTGKYWYTLTSICGFSTDTVNVVAAPPVFLDLGSDVQLCPGLSVTLTLPSDSNVYVWNDLINDRVRVISEPGVYSVTVTSPLGCQNLDSISLYDNCETTIEFPNVFTPNGDGINDAFTLQIEFATDIRCSIFDRWGMLAFSSQASKMHWDGMRNGLPASDGTYFVNVTFTDRDGHFKQFKASITLLRGN